MPYLIYDPETPNERVYELKLGVNTIGRGMDNTIVVMHGSLSRQHAKIHIAPDRVTIADLQSLNHTFVNEVQIDRCELKDGDSILCGSVVFKFVDKLASPEPEPSSDEDSQLSIVKRFSPEPTQIAMQDILYEERPMVDSSVLKLRPQDATQRAVDKLKILLELSKELSSPEEPDRLLEKILILLLEITTIDRAVILMVDEATGQLERRAVKSRSGIPFDYQFYSKRILNRVCNNGEAILTADACIDHRFSDAESILKHPIHASMCVPLKPREEVIGVLYVDNLSISGVYSDEDVEFLTALANQAAIAIDNAQLYKKMQEEAVVRDKLERFFPQAVSRKLKEEGHLEIVETEVTALFADISGFTKLSSTMKPRQVIEMLNEYFKVMVEDIVFPYEGTLEKYIGDALLAVWGAPYQKADDVDRAVQAAVEMQWAVRRLNPDWKQRRNLEIQIHIGINTGKVAAGNIGSKKLIQYATIGDTTNVTSRICNAAKAGEILISQSTFEKLSNCSLSFEKMAPVKVKGKEQPLQLYRVLWQQV